MAWTLPWGSQSAFFVWGDCPTKIVWFGVTCGNNGGPKQSTFACSPLTLTFLDLQTNESMWRSAFFHLSWYESTACQWGGFRLESHWFCWWNRDGVCFKNHKCSRRWFNSSWKISFLSYCWLERGHRDLSETQFSCEELSTQKTISIARFVDIIANGSKHNGSLPLIMTYLAFQDHCISITSGLISYIKVSINGFPWRIFWLKTQSVRFWKQNRVCPK